MGAERLALGTVQFGEDYGVANRGGRVPPSEVHRIVDIARAAGLDTLDTAVAYGDAEVRLGGIGVGDWRVVSKLPGVPEAVDDVAAWVGSQVEGSLERLGIGRLHGFLLHRPFELLASRGSELRAALLEVRGRGLADRIGLSVAGPDDLDALWDDRFDLVQIPYNVVDRRLVTSGWLERLVDDGVEVHARSAFLQGLLLMDEWPAYFGPWADRHEAWTAFCSEQGLSRLQVSLGFARAQPGIDRVVVGVDGADQLDEILAVADDPVPEPPTWLECTDPKLIDPSRWEVE